MSSQSLKKTFSDHPFIKFETLSELQTTLMSSVTLTSVVHLCIRFLAPTQSYFEMNVFVYPKIK